MLSLILAIMANIRLMLAHVVLGGGLEGALLPIWQLKTTHYLLWMSAHWWTGLSNPFTCQPVGLSNEKVPHAGLPLLPICR